MSAETAVLEKQNRELKKSNKALKTHNVFLEKWADKNFDLRQELMKHGPKVEKKAINK